MFSPTDFLMKYSYSITKAVVLGFPKKSNNCLLAGETGNLQFLGKKYSDDKSCFIVLWHLTKNIDLSKNALFLHENLPFAENTKTEPHSDYN